MENITRLTKQLQKVANHNEDLRYENENLKIGIPVLLAGYILVALILFVSPCHFNSAESFYERIYEVVNGKE